MALNSKQLTTEMHIMESTVRRLFSKGNGQEGAYRPMSSGENIKTGELKKGDNQKERGKADGRGKV
jgi:hypothetical protein